MKNQDFFQYQTKKPFYKKWYFYALVAVGAGAIGAFVVKESFSKNERGAQVVKDLTSAAAEKTEHFKVKVEDALKKVKTDKDDVVERMKDTVEKLEDIKAEEI